MQDGTGNWTNLRKLSLVSPSCPLHESLQKTGSKLAKKILRPARLELASSNSGAVGRLRRLDQGRCLWEGRGTTQPERNNGWRTTECEMQLPTKIAAIDCIHILLFTAPEAAMATA